MLLVSSGIIRARQPTQIFNAVVCLIHIYVVYGVFLYWIVVRDK